MKNKIFLIIMATASFSLHSKKPVPNNPRPDVGVDAQLMTNAAEARQSDLNELTFYYLMIVDHDVARRYANTRRSFSDMPQLNIREHLEQRALHLAQSLFGHNPDMTFTPVGRRHEDPLDLAPHRIHDVAIADNVDRLGTLRVRDMLNTFILFIQILPR